MSPRFVQVQRPKRRRKPTPSGPQFNLALVWLWHRARLSTEPTR